MKTTLEVKLNFEVKAEQGEGDEMISCSIPSIDISFMVKSWNDIERIAQKILKEHFASFDVKV